MYDQWCHMLPCQNKIENANTKMEDLSLENYLNHSNFFLEIFKNFPKFSGIIKKRNVVNKMTLAKAWIFLKRMIMSLVRSSEFSTRWCYYLQKINPRRVEWYHRYWNKKLFPKVFWWYNDIYFTWFLSALPFEHNNFRPPRHHMCSTPQFFCRGQHYDKSVHIFELFRVIGCTCALC